jgi:SAM-dependent methyltransferase
MVPNIAYDHTLNRNLHTVSGASAGLRELLRGDIPTSMLDMGCGTGTWMRAALDLGVGRVYGIDGLDLPEPELFVPKELICVADLNQPVDLRERFDLAICLETAEHLEPASSKTLVQSLVRHSSRILFSAAAPGQGGTHHVNCQWPEYWQGLFNGEGFVCNDDCRWAIWNDSDIEPWYRQNVFRAERRPELAGKEPRIKRVIHPDVLPSFSHLFLPEHRNLIEQGALPWRWYVSAPLRAALAKSRRR